MTFLLDSCVTVPLVVTNFKSIATVLPQKGIGNGEDSGHGWTRKRHCKGQSSFMASIQFNLGHTTAGMTQNATER